MLCSLSTKLKPEDLQAINALENEIGSPLLAFSCRQDLGFADVNTEQLAKIQALESKLGLSLVAVRG
jgi:sulfite reductase beta subunit-like hemoprotein